MTRRGLDPVAPLAPLALLPTPGGLTVSYDRDSNDLECRVGDRLVRAALAPRHPLDAAAPGTSAPGSTRLASGIETTPTSITGSIIGLVGSQVGDTLRLAYSSRTPDGQLVIVLVHVDSHTGSLLDAPSVSEALDDELAAAFFEAAGRTTNPAGALRDLLEFRREIDDSSAFEARGDSR